MSAPAGGPRVAPDSIPDTGAFLTRLLRLDPAALVRLRPAASGLAQLWATLPFDVLVVRAVQAEVTGDSTVRADDLLNSLTKSDVAITRRDEQWRGELPPESGRTVESVPADELRRVSDAAARTLADSLSTAAARGVGERRVRDALLDHVAITLTGPSERVEVPVRLLAGLARMGFLAADPVRFRLAGSRWLGAAATYGAAWCRRPGAPSLSVSLTG